MAAATVAGVGTQPIQLVNQSVVDAIPRTNINCTPTLKGRTEQRLAIALDPDRVWEIDTGHDLMISEPRAVAEMLLTVAALPPRATQDAEGGGQLTASRKAWTHSVR
jgi:hypothetical protein